MASSTRPVLPIANPHPAGAGAGAEPQPALRVFFSQASEYLRHGLSQRRPWSELVDRTAFSRPQTFSEATFRIGKNFTYFRINYYALTALVLAVSLLTSPFSLVVLLGLLAAWIFLYLFRSAEQPLVLFGRAFSDFETLILLSLSSLCVLFLTKVGSILGSALMVGAATICVHGAFRIPEDMFMEEQVNKQPNGYMPAVRGAAAYAASAASTAAFPVPSRR